MKRKPLLVALLLAGVTALIAVLPAAGKEGVKATLTTPLPLDAPAGKRIRIGWTLTYPDEQGKLRPFGAGYLFVRLKSASGGEAVTEYAGGDRGEYWATIAVPEGGIGDIEFGLVGWATDKNGTRRADMIFPIANDPLPGERAFSAQPTGDSGTPRWVFVVVGAAVALATVTAALIRRRPRLRFG
jgi:hypothetical protein